MIQPVGLRAFWMSLFICLALCLVCPTRAVESANPPAAPTYNNFDEAFNAGVIAYQNKDYPQAKTAFSSALEFQPQNLAAMTNLGMTHLYLKNTGWSVALLRKAVSTKPDFQTAQSALAFVLPQAGIHELPHVISSWETWRAQVLVQAPLEIFLILLAILTAGVGWFWMSWWGVRRAAIQASQPVPAPGFVKILLLAFWGFILIAAVTKAIDLSTPRATIVAEKINALSLPEAKAPQLFELSAGMEVLLNSSHDDWFQVTYPGGMTGWVPKISLMQTSGGSL